MDYNKTMRGTYLAYLTVFVWYADCTAGVNTARGGGGGVTDTGTVIRLDKRKWNMLYI